MQVKTLVLVLGLGVAVTGALVGFVALYKEPAVEPPASGEVTASNVVAQLNYLRAQAKVSILDTDYGTLSDAAVRKAADMQKLHSDSVFDSNHKHVTELVNVGTRKFGWDLHAGVTDVRTMFDKRLQTSDGKAVLLNPAYQKIGVGIVTEMASTGPQSFVAVFLLE